jgi:Ras-related protein Rab-3C
VGNKADLESARAVSAERAHKLARQLGLEFFETSAKDNTRVAEVFDKLVAQICDKMAESLDADQSMLGLTDGGAQQDGGAPAPSKSRCSC